MLIDYIRTNTLHIALAQEINKDGITKTLYNACYITVHVGLCTCMHIVNKTTILATKLETVTNKIQMLRVAIAITFNSM